MLPGALISTLFPYTTLFRSPDRTGVRCAGTPWRECFLRPRCGSGCGSVMTAWGRCGGTPRNGASRDGRLAETAVHLLWTALAVREDLGLLQMPRLDPPPPDSVHRACT